MERLILQFAAYLHVRQYSPNSIQNHRLDMLRFQDWLAREGETDLARLQQITPRNIMDYQMFLAKRLKQRSINRHLSSLKLFFKFLEEESGLKNGNPMDLVSFPKVYQDLPTMLTPAEVTLLLEAPSESHYLGLRDKAMMELLYSSGLKLNELMALNVEHLELDLGFVLVAGRRERMVPLTDQAKALLQRYVEESRAQRLLYPEANCLFPGRNGTRISRVGIWKLIKKYAHQASIYKNFNPRTLRHAFAIHLILGGMDLDGIKFLFGYRQLEAVTLYTHVNAPDFIKAYRAYHPTGSLQATSS